MQKHIWYTVSTQTDSDEFAREAEHFKERADGDRHYDDRCEEVLREVDQTGVPVWVQMFEQDDRFGTLIPMRQKYIEGGG